MSKKTEPNNDPGIESVTKYLQYTLSLPERAIRSTAAVFGGIAEQSASLLVPTAFQDSKTYKTFVKQMLDMVVHDIGGTKRDDANVKTDGEKEAEVEGYVAKKTVSTFVDLAGMATLHVSPMTILAVLSDVAYGSNVYLKELAEELKREGVIDRDSTIDHAADLLAAVGAASGKAADRFDRPPLSLEGLQETIEETQSSVGTLDPTKVIPQAEIKRMWTEMQDMAQQQDVDLIDVSSAMTMYTLNQVATVSKGLDDDPSDWRAAGQASFRALLAGLASDSRHWHLGDFCLQQPTVDRGGLAELFDRQGDHHRGRGLWATFVSHVERLLQLAGRLVVNRLHWLGIRPNRGATNIVCRFC